MYEVDPDVFVTDSAGLNLNYVRNNQGLVTNVYGPAGTLFAAVYDSCDRPLQITDAQGVSVTNTLDQLGRIEEQQSALGAAYNYYSPQGLYQLQDPLHQITTFGYDPAGRLACITNANQEITGCSYNAAGEMLTLTNGNGHVSSWAYDAYGRKISKIDGNNNLVETNGYDAGGRRTAHWTPAKGLTQYSYDANGNVQAINFSSGPGISAGYDALNRIQTMSDAVGTSAFTYANFGAFGSALATEDGPWAADTVTHAYTQRMQRSVSLAQQGGAWTENFGYDSSLRLQTVTSAAGSFVYGYNGAGRQVQSLALPGGSTIAQSYGGAGELLNTVLQHGAAVLDAYSYTYDADGNRLSVTRPDNAYVNYGYDNIGQLVSTVGFEPGGVTPRANENFGYSYDPAGNLLTRANNTLLQTFTSDNANELVNVSRNNDVLTIEGNVTNLPSALRVNGQAATIYNDKTFALTNSVALNNGLNVFTTVITSAGLTMTNLLNKTLPTSQNLGYDLNGNLTSDGVHGYDYDCVNELIRVTLTNQWKVEYTYDGFGRRRIRKEFAWQGSQWLNASEVHYIYDGMQVLQERTVLNTPTVTYTRGLGLSDRVGGAGGIGGLLARTDNNGSAYYHADGNGNVTMLVDGSGNMLAKYLYDSFGNTLGMWGALATVNTYRFSSKEIDLRTGQYYYGYRYYEPNLQRWLNQDPIQERGGINLYRFVNNDPIDRIDPNGLLGLMETEHSWTWHEPRPPAPTDPIQVANSSVGTYGWNSFFGDPADDYVNQFWFSIPLIQDPERRNKCNKFVGDCISACPNRTKPFINKRFPTASEWHDPHVQIPGYGPPHEPRPGDVVTDGHHVGFMNYDGNYVEASSYGAVKVLDPNNNPTGWHPDVGRSPIP